MRKSTKFIIMTLAAGMLTACGTDKPTEVITNVEANTTIEAKTKEEAGESTETNKESSVNQNTETKNADDKKTENQESKEASDKSEKEMPSVETLSKAYAEYIERIAIECYTPEELVFTTIDVNDDGIQELLYAESSVNAAGVYVCFYDDGQINPVGPFGSYGGIQYAPSEGRIISVMDNMDYMVYEVYAIDKNYEKDLVQKFAIEPDSEGNGYDFFWDDEEVSMEEYTEAFAKLQNMDVREIDYDDMYMYTWCSSDSDPIEKHFEKLLTGYAYSKESRMIIPMVEKAKLVGTWEIYSSQIEDSILYARDGEVSGKITVHEDYTVDLDYGYHKMSGMTMEFYHGSFNSYADNNDWYVVINAKEEDGTIIYMNVSDDDRLTVNTIGEGEILSSMWDIYTRVK